MQKHILLIDDDEDEYDMFLMVLGQVQGVTCSYASSAINGMRILATDKPDLVFLDVNMPLVDGLKCLTGIRNTAGLEDLPVVIYTTSGDASLKENALRLGASDFVQKPQSISDLEVTLRKICDRVLGI